MPDDRLRIKDVLDIRHPELPRWAPDGTRVWFLYRVDGRPELWVSSADQKPYQMSRPGDRVAFYAPLPEGACYAAGGTLVMVDSEGPPRVLVDMPTDIGGLAASAPGRIAFTAGDDLWIVSQEPSGNPLVQSIELFHPLAGALEWSPSGRRLLLSVLRHRAIRALSVFDLTSRTVLYETPEGTVPVQGRFLDEETLLIVRSTPDAMRREVLLVEMATRAEHVLYTEADPRGIVTLGEASVSPRGDAAVFMGTIAGYPHLLLWERGQTALTTMLSGAHEDHGEEHESPSFSADGMLVAFSSSHGGPAQGRQVYLFSRVDRQCRALTEPTGTHVDPVLSPDGTRVAYLSASDRESLELYTASIPGAPRRMTHSMPGVWARSRLVPAEPVELMSLDGFRFHADLYRPSEQARSPGPALIYVHGGPMRQMRAGFHPMHAYAVFHAWNQYLLQQGYTILSVDYRGGTGYGVDFERGNYEGPGQGDLADVIAGARYVKSLPGVDADRVGIWGLSYGGYLTLLALTKFPKEFRLGVNLAGMWTYPESSGAGRVRFWERRLGGPRSPVTTRHYDEASPAHYAEHMTAPLLNLHGTADESVEFQHLDAIVRDLTRLHKRFELMYYPEESHFFHRRETWEDAFTRMEEFFARELSGGAGSESR